MVNCQEEEAVDTSEEEIDCLPSLIHVVRFSFGEKEEESDSIKAPLLTRGEVGGYCHQLEVEVVSLWVELITSYDRVNLLEQCVSIELAVVSGFVLLLGLRGMCSK